MLGETMMLGRDWNLRIELQVVQARVQSAEVGSATVSKRVGGDK